MQLHDNRIIQALIILALGWVALALPVYMDFATGAWTRDENAHAPFVLAIVIAGFYLRCHSLNKRGWPDQNRFRISWHQSFSFFILCLGWVLYGLGRAGEVELFSSASLLLIIVGGLMTIGGRALLAWFWFPVLMMFYLIVFPGWLLDTLTGPMKLWISEAATWLLSALGLPVAHSGVVIAAGPYQLLVADACSGLNSLLAMTAVGAVYLYVIKRRSIALNAFLFASIIPLAIFANFIRVCLLVWITLGHGYDAGQGFLHEFAGLMMFAIALSGLFLLDSLTSSPVGRRGIWRFTRRQVA